LRSLTENGNGVIWVLWIRDVMSEKELFKNYFSNNLAVWFQVHTFALRYRKKGSQKVTKSSL
jgi:hypothetical protein